jgi:hypothetical protein
MAANWPRQNSNFFFIVVEMMGHNFHFTEIVQINIILQNDNHHHTHSHTEKLLQIQTQTINN